MFRCVRTPRREWRSAGADSRGHGLDSRISAGESPSAANLGAPRFAEIRVRRDDRVPMFTRPIPDDAVVDLLQLDLANVQEAWKQGAQAKDQLG